MAFDFDRIGDFTFLKLSGHPLQPKAEWDLEVRPGVDGIGLWRTGIRGEPFQIWSLVFTYNLETAQALYNAYVAHTNVSSGLVVRRAGLDNACRYKVLDVKPVEGSPRRIVGYVGGDNQTYFAELICVWTLLPLDEPPTT